MREIHYPGITQSPKEFLENRTLMSSLGKAEAEEVFHRILRFSLQEDRWVVPTGQELDAQVQADLAQIRETEEIRKRNREIRMLYERKARWNWFRKLFGKEIQEPVYEKEKELPFTFLTINPNALIIGIHHMRENGFLEIDVEDGENYFRVTEKALLAMPIVK